MNVQPIRSWFLVLFSAVLTLPAYAQVQEEVEVLLRDLRVHVYDEKGRSVKNLTAADFEVFEDGIAREIGFFEAVNLAGFDEDDTDPLAPSDKPFARSHSEEPRYVVILLDSGNMEKSSFKRAKTAVKSFIEESVDDGVFVKIVQLDDTMNHLTPFTAEKRQMMEGIDAAKYHGMFKLRLFALEKEIVDNLLYYGEVAKKEATFTNTRQLQTGNQVRVAHRINALIQEKERLKADYYHTYYLNMVALARVLRPISGSKSIFMLSGGNFVEPNPTFQNTQQMGQKLSRILNTVNATVYTFLHMPRQTSSERLLHGAANRRPIDVIDNETFSLSSLQNSGSFPPNQSTPLLQFNTILENNEQLKTGPSMAAEETGGLFYASTSPKDFARRLEDYYFKSGRYYRIGYTVFANEVKKRPKLKIRLKGTNRSAWRLVYGEALERAPKYESLSAEDRMLEFESQLLFSQTNQNDLNCDWGYELFPEGLEGYRIPVFSRLDIEEALENGLEVGFAALGSQYEVLDITRSEVTKVKSGEAVLLYDLLVTPYLPKFLRYYVRDMNDGSLSFREIELNEDQVEKPGKFMSNLVLATADQAHLIAFNHFRRSADPVDKLRKDRDPLLMGDTLFKPATKYAFQRTDTAGFLFHLYEQKRPSKQYGVDIQLLRGDQQVAVSGRVTNVFPLGEEAFKFYGRIDTSSLDPGEYLLKIEVQNPETGDTYQQTRTFSLL